MFLLILVATTYLLKSHVSSLQAKMLCPRLWSLSPLYVLWWSLLLGCLLLPRIWRIRCTLLSRSDARCWKIFTTPEVTATRQHLLPFGPFHICFLPWQFLSHADSLLFLLWDLLFSPPSFVSYPLSLWHNAAGWQKCTIIFPFFFTFSSVSCFAFRASVFQQLNL